MNTASKAGLAAVTLALAAGCTPTVTPIPNEAPAGSPPYILNQPLAGGSYAFSTDNGQWDYPTNYYCDTAYRGSCAGHAETLYNVNGRAVWQSVNLTYTATGWGASNAGSWYYFP